MEKLQTAREVMRDRVQTVHSEMPLPELDRAFIDHKMGGFPVVDGGRLVGIVSRSDIVPPALRGTEPGRNGLGLLPPRRAV